MTEPQTAKVSHPSLTAQAFWLMAARTVAYALSFALPIVLARVFTTQEFGIYKQAFLVVMTCAVILPLNFNLSAFYFLPREPARKPSIVLNVLLAYTVAAGAACAAIAFYPGTLKLLLGDTELLRLSGLVAVIVCLSTFSALAESLATANQDVRYSTVFIIGSQVTKTALLLGSALIFGTIEALLWAAVVQGAIQSAVLLWYVAKHFPGWWRSFDGPLLRTQAAYVLPFGFSAVLWKIQMDLHSYIVANRFSDADFAIYAVGVSQLPLTALFRDSINSVLLARMSSLQQSDQRREIIRLFFTAMRKLAIVYIPAVAVLLVLGRELIVLMYTRAYERSWPIFALNLLTLLTSIVSVDAILRAYSAWRFFLMKLRVVLIVWLIVSTFIAIREFGLIGAVAALVVTLFIERVILAFAVSKTLEMRAADWKLAMPVLWFAGAAVVSAATAVVVREALLPYGPAVTVAGGAAAFAAVYIFVVAWFGLLDQSEQTLVRQYAGKLPLTIFVKPKL